MAALSDYAEKLLLDYSMTTGSVTRPTAWYVALYTAAPSDSGGGTEVSFGTVVAIGIHDAVSGGNLLWHGNMTASKTIADGDTLEFSAGNIDLTLA